MTHYSVKEAAGFRKASDYVLKGIFNAYRKDPAFRKFYGLDNIGNLQRGRNRAITHAIQKSKDQELINTLSERLATNASVSKRSLRQAEFTEFKNRLSSNNLLNPEYPFINKRSLYTKGPINMAWGDLPGAGRITGGFDPLVLSLMKYKDRMPRSWTQVLGHELGHGILRDMNSHNIGKALIQPFRRAVLKNYRTNLTPAQKDAVLKYAVNSGNQKALTTGIINASEFFRNPRKNAARLFKIHPELDERAADAIAMSIGQGNSKINRSIANHFNRYYRNVKGPVGWRARHLLRAE